MQPATWTEPPDTRKKSELPKSRHFAAYSTYEHRPNPRARKVVPQKVSGKKGKELPIRTRSPEQVGTVDWGCAGDLASVSARTLEKELLVRSAYGVHLGS